MPARSRLWPDPRAKPPAGTAQLDRGHSLGASVEAAFLLNEGGGPPMGSARGFASTPQGNAAWTTSHKGLARRYATSGDVDAYPDLDGVGATAQLTLVAYCPLDAGPLSGGVIASKCDGNAGQYDWFMQRSGADDNLRLLYNLGTAATSGINATARDFYAVAASASGVTWQSGSLTATSGGITLVARNKRLALGGRFLNPTYDLSMEGTLTTFYWFRRALSFGELAWLRAEPYAMFRPIVRRHYSIPAAVPSPSLTPPVASMLFAPVAAASSQGFRLTPGTA